MTELERLRAWEAQHDAGIPPGPLDRQSEADRLRDVIAVNERLAREFDDIAHRRAAAGAFKAAQLNRGDAAFHRNAASRARDALDRLPNRELPVGPRAMQALGDGILGPRRR